MLNTRTRHLHSAAGLARKHLRSHSTEQLISKRLPGSDRIRNALRAHAAALMCECEFIVFQPAVHACAGLLRCDSSTQRYLMRFSRRSASFSICLIQPRIFAIDFLICLCFEDRLSRWQGCVGVAFCCADTVLVCLKCRMQ